MDLEQAREDLLVAGVAAGCAIGLTLGFEYVLAASIPLQYRLIPLLVYVVYVFSRKGGPYGRYDTPMAWAVLAVLVTVATAVVVA
ncbi:hypothetical protein AArcSl_1976 [Halalkaliarchaeum desulfuricum]|uniref:DUF8049 domain-containing protein n=1 Tax=Halalkaliarchaeum desulfuricum TaxID=2055893 RepID=A0A343TKH9_9EURY|nr:hypothetical protein [Halalkaliarchaeum desulfuricum]AUX09601.1 hypothetical protein AArcSl_1976 [Halalkaliarchaeum desulfuricum]